MVRTSTNNLVSHNNEPGHDKVYIASVRKMHDGRFGVYGKWSARNRAMKEMNKGTFSTFAEAQRAAEELFAIKAGRGYVDIESSQYHGPVTFDSVSQWLEQPCGEDEPVSTTAAPVKQRNVRRKPVQRSEFEVKCVNTTGIESHFDVGVNYMARLAGDADLLEVMDVQGEWIEALRSRFEVVEG